MRPDESDAYPGRSYRFYTGGDEVFKFGDGLSYSTFATSVTLLPAVTHPAVAAARKTTSLAAAGGAAADQDGAKGGAEVEEATRLRLDASALASALADPSGYRRGSSAAVATAAVTVANLRIAGPDGRAPGRAGAEAALVFVAPPNGSAGAAGAPRSSLAGFGKVALAAGEQDTVRVALRPHHFAVPDATGRLRPVKGAWEVWVGNAGRGEALVVEVL